MRRTYSIYCEHRNFNREVVENYNARKRAAISESTDLMIISGWYRRALGFKPTPAFHPGMKAELIVSRPRFSAWADLRASCQHPEPGVRIATRLGLLGAWLGVAALLPALVDGEPIKSWLETQISYPTLSASIVSILFGLVCIWAGRGVTRPNNR